MNISENQHKNPIPISYFFSKIRDLANFRWNILYSFTPAKPLCLFRLSSWKVIWVLSTDLTSAWMIPIMENDLSHKATQSIIRLFKLLENFSAYWIKLCFHETQIKFTECPLSGLSFVSQI